MDQASKNFSDLPTLNLEEGKKPPKTRIKNGQAALEVFNLLRQADEASAWNRARVQAMLDGTPPYSDAKLRATGQGFRTNINFGEGEGYLEQAMSAYVDLINSVEQVVRIETKFGDPNERKEYSRIISEEFTLQVRKWPRFMFEFLNLCNQFIAHGVGVTYFEDAKSWKWKSSGLGDFLIPRDTKATESEIDISAAERKVTVPDLYKWIENPEAATQMGWNVELVKKVIMQAASEHKNWDNWEELQREVKNNDLYTGAKAAKIRLVHVWVQEFDNTITHYIIDGNEELGKETPKAGDGFLYKSVGKYKHITEAFTFFTYGVGTNGTYHSIRGLGYKIFAHMQLNNRIRCQAVDNSMIAGAPMVQPNDERALEDLAFNYFGPFAILPPGVNFVDRAAPNVSQTMMPILGELDRIAQNRAGQYSTSSTFQGDQRKTRFEVAAQLEDSSKLTDTSLNLFYNPWDRLLYEVVRRFFKSGYGKHTDGYREVKELRERCMERGVPEGALDAIDFVKTKAVRAVGNGSSGKRTVQLQQLNALAGVYDEEGRHNLFRDQTAAIVGHDAADRYIPPRPDGRFGVHAKVAQLENRQLMQGEEIEVLVDEVHLTHLQFHVPELEQLFQQVEEGLVEITDAVLPAMPLFQHCVAHLENIQADPTIAEKIGEYNERLQKVSELIVNGQKALEKLRREEAQAAEEAGQEQAQGGPQISPEMESKFAEHQLKLQMMQEKHQAEMMIRLQKHQQNMELEDAKRAVDIKDLLR